MSNRPSKESILARAEQLMAERIAIPESKSGKLSIQHKVIPAGKELITVGIRESMYAGLPQCDLVLDHDIVIRSLYEEDQGTWMTDMPCELFQMERELASQAKGRVLVGGLGLGVLPNMVAKKDQRRIEKIVVVEKSPDVIKLVAPYLPSNVEVIEADIHEYIKTIKSRQFNVALLDTWQMTGEWCWQTEVVPLRRAIGRKIRNVHCWQEDVMTGQVWQMLPRMADTDEDLLRSRGTCHYYAFRCAARDQHLRREARITKEMAGAKEGMMEALRIGEENRQDKFIQLLAKQYVHCIGQPIWELVFGKYWNEAWDIEKKRKEVA